MHLTHFQCRGFRALSDIAFEPARGINVIRGHNAQGKTSVLEAILFATTSKSHRTTDERDLVAHGERDFHVYLRGQRTDRDVAIDAHWWNGTKRFRINGVAQTRVSEVLGKLAVVIFSPEDIELVKGGAATRRRFLDMELSQVNPAYLNALQQYRQVLRQRNELLRQPRPDTDLLDVWDVQLAEHGTAIIGERASFLDQLSPLAAVAYQRISGGEGFSVNYTPDVPPDESLASVLAKARPSDLRRAMTTHGPHRDDIEICVAGQPARNFASQGQQKSAALALKLAELDLVKGRMGEYPVLMLDEVLSELDAKRSRQLFDAIDESVQSLLTTTQLDDSELFGRFESTFLRIERGHLEKE